MMGTYIVDLIVCVQLSTCLWNAVTQTLFSCFFMCIFHVFQGKNRHLQGKNLHAQEKIGLICLIIMVSLCIN